MQKILVGAQVSMDGIMPTPGGPTKDPTKGLKLVAPCNDRICLQWTHDGVGIGTEPSLSFKDRAK